MNDSSMTKVVWYSITDYSSQWDGDIYIKYLLYTTVQYRIL